MFDFVPTSCTSKATTSKASRPTHATAGELVGTDLYVVVCEEQGPQREGEKGNANNEHCPQEPDVRQWNRKHVEPGRAYLPPLFQARTNLTSMVEKCLQSTGLTRT